MHRQSSSSSASFVLQPQRGQRTRCPIILYSNESPPTPPPPFLCLCSSFFFFAVTHKDCLKINEIYYCLEYHCSWSSLLFTSTRIFSFRNFFELLMLNVMLGRLRRAFRRLGPVGKFLDEMLESL
ncbi:hypothetical protein IHE45_03G011900 [Dioscorea alata]|uniref:Uncharacterized protein n=1 Tax=Dioscorea alata TaxID=55571 RepID=A0ACB7WJD6_DIOAL|nr:hypothetical protein IHE45_03G011900 [Dioscorea alata]